MQTPLIKEQTKRIRLTPEAVLDAALLLASQIGVEKVSMRKLASLLDVTAMAIYRHFDNTDTLRAAMLDRFVQKAKILPKNDLIWNEWLHHVSQNMFTLLTLAPDWIPLFGKINLRPTSLEVLDDCLAALENAGFSTEQAVEAFFVMIHSVIGAASLQANFSNPTTLDSKLMDQFPETSYAKVRNALPEVAKIDHGSLLAKNLDRLICSMRANKP